MEAEAAKLLGAGLAAIGVGMAALGVGNVFGSFLESALRNPAAADSQQGRLFIGFAAAELLGLIAFAVAMKLVAEAVTPCVAAPPPPSTSAGRLRIWAVVALGSAFTTLMNTNSLPAATFGAGV